MKMLPRFHGGRFVGAIAALAVLASAVSSGMEDTVITEPPFRQVLNSSASQESSFDGSPGQDSFTERTAPEVITEPPFREILNTSASQEPPDHDSIHRHHVLNGTKDQIREWHPLYGEVYRYGDMLLTSKQQAELEEKSCIQFKRSLWPKSQDGLVHIPYFIHASLPADARNLVPVAVAQYAEKTCLRFFPVSPYDPRHKLRIQFGSGCNSLVGHMVNAQRVQDVNLGRGCAFINTVVHEMAHATGVFHEQSRPDRDQHLVINMANVMPAMQHNFGLVTCDTENVPYDLTGVMQYKYEAFSRDGSEVMVTKNVMLQYLLGRNDFGLTHRDQLLINRAYGCIEGWLFACKKQSDPCQNDGYLGPSCQCVCPRGTSGSLCETKTGEYYPPNPLGCGGMVTTEATIQTPVRHPKGECVWLIQAPRCHQVRLSFLQMTFYRPENCHFESLTIRNNDLYLGRMYCYSRQLGRGSVIQSMRGTIVLHWASIIPNGSTGFQARVQFVRGGPC